MRRAYVFLLLLISAASFAYVVAPVSNAAASVVPVRFGIGNQHPTMFEDRRWQAMGLKITRYNIPWDAADDPAALQAGIDFVDAARKHGVDVLMHLTGRIYDGAREPIPTRANYGHELKKLLAVFRPMGVNTWGVWDEEDHPTQSTYGHPARAAQFFLEMHEDCTGCQIDALDLLTSGGVHSTAVGSYRGYTKRFFVALGKKASLVKVIGIHNYGELINQGSGAAISRDYINYAKRYNKTLHAWITESGGLASSRSRLCSETRQAVGERRMFIQAAALAKNGLQRLYMYNWDADNCGYLFDSGLIRPDGTARLALGAIQTGARRFAR